MGFCVLYVGNFWFSQENCDWIKVLFRDANAQVDINGELTPPSCYKDL